MNTTVKRRYVRGGQVFTCRECNKSFRGYGSKRPVHCSAACRYSRSRGSVAERLQKRTTVVGNCWIISGTPDKDGYVQFWVGKKNRRAHQVGWELANGPIPPGKVVCHTCDTPACWRNDGPDGHLFIATQAANMADKVAKNRQAKGDRHGMAKLTEPQAREVLRLHRAGQLLPELALRFGVTYYTIWDLVTGRSWAHLEREEVPA